MKKINFKVPVLTERGTITELNATGIIGLVESIDFKKVLEHLFMQKKEIQEGKRPTPYIQYVDSEKYQSFIGQIKNKQRTELEGEIKILDGNNLIVKIKCLEEKQKPSKSET